MGADFRSEWQSWRAVLALRKWTMGFFSGLIVFLVALLLILVWEYQVLSIQISQLSNQIELIVEIDENLSQEQVSVLQKEIQSLPMVNKIDYWPIDRSVAYIDSKILAGYSGFLQKIQSDIPVNPLFRIQTNRLQDREELEGILMEKYPQQITFMDSLVKTEGQSFARQFIAQIGHSALVFQVSIVLLLVLMAGIYAYLISFILSERSGGFHLTQMLHLSPPYAFAPALMLMTGMALVLNFLGFLLAFFFLGKFLVLMALSLFIVFFLINIILVWFGRFVILRWGMR